MYKDSDISLEVYQKYNSLVSLFKKKGASSGKLYDLEILLNYFINNLETFNEEEKKLIKNVLMMSKGIVSKVNNGYKFIKERRDDCIKLIETLYEKQKEPIK